MGWGFFFERMVRSVKRCLKKISQSAHLTYEELLTVFLEVEAVLSSRCLSYVSTEDLEEPLTPSNLISSRLVLSCTTVDPGDVDVASVQRDGVL